MNRTPPATALAGAGAVAFLVAGCATSPVERTFVVGPTECMHPPRIKLARLNGAALRLDLIRVKPDACLADYRCLYIPPPALQGNATTGLTDKQVAKMLKHLAQRLRTHLSSYGVFELATTNKEFLADMATRHKICRLDTTITDVELGTPWQRYFVGFDAGGVEVQLEGRLVDDRTDQVLLEFADRRLDSGNPRFGFNTRVWDGAYLVRKNLGIQSYWVAQFIYHAKTTADKLAAATQPRVAKRQLYDIRR